jgi:hypothetical protein
MRSHNLLVSGQFPAIRSIRSNCSNDSIDSRKSLNAAASIEWGELES